MGKEPVYTKTETGVAIKKENASFYVDIETGNAYFKGVIQAEDFLDAKGNRMVEMLQGKTPYQFKPEYLNLKGLTITDDAGAVTLKIDQNGHVTMQGDITINNGAPNGTFISGTNIYTPTIQSPTIQWYDNNGDLLGEIKQGAGSNQGSATVLLEMFSMQGISLKALSGGISFIADGGIWFSSRAGALKGLDIKESFRIAGNYYSPAHNSDDWTDMLKAFRDIEIRLNSAESNINGLSARISVLES